METFDVPLIRCRKCGNPLDSACSVNCNIQPKPGDVSICFYCAAVSVFADDMSLREPNAEEQRTFKKDREIAKAIQNVKIIMRRRGAKFN